MLLFSVLSGEQLTTCLAITEDLQKYPTFYPTAFAPDKLFSCISPN